MTSTPSFQRRSFSSIDHHEEENHNTATFGMNSPPIVLEERHVQQQMLQDYSYVQRLDQQLRVQREHATTHTHPSQLKIKIPQECSTSSSSLRMLPPSWLDMASTTPREQCPECAKKAMTTPTTNSHSFCSTCASRERRQPATTTTRTYTTPQSSKAAPPQQQQQLMIMLPRNYNQENNNAYFLSSNVVPSPAVVVPPNVDGRLATAPGLNIDSKMDEDAQDGRIQLRPRKQMSQPLSLSSSSNSKQTPPIPFSERRNESEYILPPITTTTISLNQKKPPMLAPRADIPRSVSAPLLPLMSPQQPHTFGF